MADLFREYWPVVVPSLLYFAEIAFRVTMVVVVLARRRNNPSATLAWIMLIVALPIIGAVLYIMIGDISLGRRARERHSDIVAHMTMLEAKLIDDPPDRPVIEDRFLPVSRLAEHVSERPPRAGNRLQLLNDTAAVIQAMVEDIGEARRHCHLLMYIYLNDHSGRRVGEALIAAAERGVTCRVLVDAVGSRPFLRSDLCRRMRAAGVQVVAALPVNPLRMLFARIDLRNHRKILIVDSRIGYTGSQNIADPEFAPKRRFAPWYDCMVRAEGHVVADLQMLFIEDWHLDTEEELDEAIQARPDAFETGVTAQVVGSGPNSPTEAMRNVMLTAVHAAQDELIITTPYFVPDASTVSALCTAAQRGVDTHLVLPARNDSPLVAAASRSHYATLLEAGVNIHEFRGGLLHVKTLTVDRDLGIVGSANLDRRSFEINFEVAMVVFDTDFASELRFMQRSYMHQATVIALADWRERGRLRQIIDNAAGLMSPLL